MNGDSKQPEELTPWVEPSLEARLVALVLGEASDFEREELERLMTERPELAVFVEQIESVHSRLTEIGVGERGAAEAPGPWRLENDRRTSLLDALGGKTRAAEAADEVTVLEVPAAASAAAAGSRSKRQIFWRVTTWAAAACVVLGAGLFAIAIFSSAGGKFIVAMNEESEQMEMAGERRSYRLWSANPPTSESAASAAPDDGASWDNSTQAHASSQYLYSTTDELQFDRYGRANRLAGGEDPGEGAAEKSAPTTITGFSGGTAEFGISLQAPGAAGGAAPGDSFEAGLGVKAPAKKQGAAAADHLAFADAETNFERKISGKGQIADMTAGDAGTNRGWAEAAQPEPFAEAKPEAPSESNGLMAIVPQQPAQPGSGAPRLDAINAHGFRAARASGAIVDASGATGGGAMPLGGAVLGNESRKANLNADQPADRETLSRREFETAVDNGSGPAAGPMTSDEESDPVGVVVLSDGLEAATEALSKTRQAQLPAIQESTPPAPPARPAAPAAAAAAPMSGPEPSGEPMDRKVLAEANPNGKEAEIGERESRHKQLARVESRLSEESVGQSLAPAESPAQAPALQRPEELQMDQQESKDVADLAAEKKEEHWAYREKAPPDYKYGDAEPDSPVDSAKYFGNFRRVAEPVSFPEILSASEPFSTFSLNVSDVSFKLAQASLANGEWPESAKIRIEEFVNAFDYGDPMPSAQEKIACQHEQVVHPFLQQRNLLRISMRTAAAGRSSQTPLRLTLLLDYSGSMERADRRESIQRAFGLLAQQLLPEDQVTLIGFARQPRLLADQVSGAEVGKNLTSIVANTPSEGGTNLEAALRLAMEKAYEQKLDNAQNRVVLITDGAANLGDAEPERLAGLVESMRLNGVAFDAAGVGAEGFNDEVLEALTRKGDGRYYFLNQPDDADDGFAKQIAGALRPAAMNVKVQVEFNPGRVGRYKLLGYEKHRLATEDFRNDSVDAAEMAAAEAGVALYQFEPLPNGSGDVGSVSVRFRDMSTGQMVEKRWPIPYEPTAPRIDEAAPSIRLATSAAMLAAKLKGDPVGDAADLSGLARVVGELPERQRSDPRVQQLLQMIEQARSLAGAEN